MIDAISTSEKDDGMGSLIEHAYILSQQILELKLPENLSLLTQEQSERSIEVINELKAKLATYKRIAALLNSEIASSISDEVLCCAH